MSKKRKNNRNYQNKDSDKEKNQKSHSYNEELENKDVVVEKDAHENSDNDKEKTVSHEISDDKITDKVEVSKNDDDINESIEEDDVDNSFVTTNIDTKELNSLIDEDVSKKNYKKKIKKHTLVNIFLILILITSIGYFSCTLLNKESSAIDIVTSLIITLFTVIFTVVGISYRKNNKILAFFGGVLLGIFLLIGINNNLSVVNTPGSEMKDFTGKSLTEVVKWANKNNIVVNQDYEYSDMIPEYQVISQDIEAGKSISDIQEITVSVSEGPSPTKEVVVPSMLTWDAERVINFVESNYLNNVIVEFKSSDQDVDTVIEQSASGNLARDEELKLTFSYGEELGYDEVSLIDFTNKSKFEIEFYMKQHQLNYKIEEDFSSKIKKGYGIKQSIDASEKVKVNDEEVVVTISKGPKIKVPDLSKMSVTELTEWAIENKLKLKFTDKYDDSVKKGEVIKTDKSKGDILKQGDTIEVTLSRGSLKMPKFDNLDDFREWADKYEIKYEEEHEFSDSVEKGEVISYSYSKGDTIKNGDVIIVKISDGKKVSVPDLIGLTKKEAKNKLDDLNLKYNFIYKSSSKSKDTVIAQSISKGSEVSDNITITITLSSGKEDSSTNKKDNSSSSSSKSNTSSTSKSDSSSKTDSSPSPSPSASTEPSKKCDTITVYLQAGNTYDQTVSIIKSAYSKINFTFTKVDKCSNGNTRAGTICNANSYDEKSLSTCETYNLQIVGN